MPPALNDANRQCRRHFVSVASLRSAVGIATEGRFVRTLLAAGERLQAHLPTLLSSFSAEEPACLHEIFVSLSSVHEEQTIEVTSDALAIEASPREREVLVLLLRRRRLRSKRR